MSWAAAPLSCAARAASAGQQEPGVAALRFVADRWLAADRGDGQTWVTLAPALPGTAARADSVPGALPAAVVLKHYRLTVRRGGSSLVRPH